jgi:RNA polymerase sigma factor (sigma-70 family)
VKAKDINKLQEIAKKGDLEAEKELFAVLNDIFLIFVQHRLWNKVDSEDIVQDALTAISLKHKEIEFESSFSAWAYKVLKNTLLKYYRTKNLREKKYEELSRDDRRRYLNEFSQEINFKLKICLKKLNVFNRRYARILNLRYHGFTTDEICSKMKITINNVYSLLTRARSRLKLCLKTGDIE